jgi:hypothetical protein
MENLSFMCRNNMTRRNQKYYVEIEWENNNPSKRNIFRNNYQVSSMAVASNRAVRDWRKSLELNHSRPSTINIKIERQETTILERGEGKRKKLK